MCKLISLSGTKMGRLCIRVQRYTYTGQLASGYPTGSKDCSSTRPVEITSSVCLSQEFSMLLLHIVFICAMCTCACTTAI